MTVAAIAADIGATPPVVTAVPADTNEDNSIVTLGAQGTDTVITVKVAAENGSDTDYIITIYRENIVLSDFVTLAALSVLPAMFPTVPTEITFAPGTTEYTARTTEAVVTVAADTS